MAESKDVEQEKKKKEAGDTEEEFTSAEKRALRQEKRADKRKECEERRKNRKKWHILSILRGIWLFFLWLFKIIYFPYVYAFWKIRDTFKFLGQNDKENLDRDLISKEDDDEIPDGYMDEKGFLRSLPMFYFIAGALGGILAIFLVFDFMDPVWKAIGDFFRFFDWSTFWADIRHILELIFVDGIWFAMKTSALWIWSGIVWLFTGGRFWIPLTTLIILGIVIIIIAVIFSEVEFSGKIIQKIKAFFKSIFTFPRIVWRWMKKAYLGWQLIISRFTFGEKKLKHFQKRFFYRVVIYSSVITLWIIVSVFVTVLTTEMLGVDVRHQLVYPIGLLIIGVVNGVFLLAFLSWFVGILSGEKYVVDLDAYHKYQEEKKLAKLEKKTTT
ncbi:MAG: hypothetical protein KGD59_14690 [Candidatus Heimdallarchaeota archaeon]|nr:hypothetical protein [Candidatus Heimdallarchaeota archaeon]MBY8995795.1 hypothetical protein [Candidatus Heimdallarchaeota archaeon]